MQDATNTLTGRIALALEKIEANVLSLPDSAQLSHSEEISELKEALARAESDKKAAIEAEKKIEARISLQPFPARYALAEHERERIGKLEAALSESEERNKQITEQLQNEVSKFQALQSSYEDALAALEKANSNEAPNGETIATDDSLRAELAALRADRAVEREELVQFREQIESLLKSEQGDETIDAISDPVTPSPETDPKES